MLQHRCPTLAVRRPRAASCATLCSASSGDGHSTGKPAGKPCRFFRTVKDKRVCDPEFNFNPDTVRVEPFHYPEVTDDKSGYFIQHIADKPSLGLAMSGGGFRAATCASGWARGLHQLRVTRGKVELPSELNEDRPSVLSKARYLSSTSGGSWFNAAFSYAPSKHVHNKEQLDEFLGEYVEAKKLTKKLLEPDKLPDNPTCITDVIAVRNSLDTFGSAWLRRFFRLSTVLENLHDYLPFDRENPLHKALDAAVLFAHKVDELLALPEKTLMEELQRVVSPNGRVWTDEEEADQGGVPIPAWLRPWSRAVARTFLHPYNLAIYDNSTVSAAKTEGQIDERAATASTAITRVLLACTDEDRPYPIFTGSLFNKELPHEEPKPDGGWIFPYEFTPLYFGTPGAFPKAQLRADPNATLPIDPRKPGLGGGYVEPWGLHAVPAEPCGLNDAKKEVRVDRSSSPEITATLHTVPLAQALAISSSFLAAGANQIPVLANLTSTETLFDWGVLPSNETPCYGPIKWGDGGMIDNLGLAPLLRRGVKAIIVMVASSAPPDDTWERWAQDASDVASWFGAARTQIIPGFSAAELNDQNCVFARDAQEGEELFREMFDDVHHKLRTGRPGFHRASYKVYENHFHHIPASGEEEVEVLWIFNHQWGDWEDLLPEETRKMLEADREGYSKLGIHWKRVMQRKLLEGELFDKTFLKQEDLRRFPYFTTFSLEYSPKSTTMLSQLCTAVIRDPQVTHHIEELLAKAKAHAARPIHAARAVAHA